MVDPDNAERLLKIPPSVVAEIQAAARDAEREALELLALSLVDTRFGPDDERRYVQSVRLTSALAAIDALRGEYGDCMHLAEMYVGETKSHGSVIECLQCGQLRTDDSQVPPRPLDYAAGVDAAREAVAGLHRVDRSEQYGDEISRDEALAAIDALRGAE